jgi:hypothetical protein
LLYISKQKQISGGIFEKIRDWPNSMCGLLFMHGEKATIDNYLLDAPLVLLVEDEK